MKNLNGVITSGLEVTGAALFVAGVALVSIPIAFCLAGLALIGISFLVVRK